MASGSDGLGSSKKSAKSTKAIAAAQKKSKARTKKGAPGGGRNIPWMTLGGVAVVAALIVALGISLYPKYQAEEVAQQWAPTEENPDPSGDIDGIVKVDYAAQMHVTPDQRVAYDHAPPFGGPHDNAWATCMGNVYPNALRSENAVHSLEHGAVWITYNPDTLPDDQRETLVNKVDGKPYLMMSPYPDQESPISLQSWGRQLTVESADDERIIQFISALRANPTTNPEPDGTCATALGFDPENPQAFDPSPVDPADPNAVLMDGTGIRPQSPDAGLPGMGGLPDGTQLPPELQQQQLQNGGGAGLPSDLAPNEPAPNETAPADGSAPAGQ